MADMYERKPQNLTGPEGSKELRVKYIDNGDGTWSLAVGALVLPLPDGAATAAKQDTTNVKLDDIIAAERPTVNLAGEKVVTDYNTPVAIASSTAASYVLVQAKTTNVSNIFVGNSSAQKVELEPGQAWAFAIDNLSKVYVRALTNNDGINYTGGAPA